MSTISRDTAPNVDDPGPVGVRSGELASYTVDFMTVRQGHDMAPLLVGLPDDRCPCPHWGYVLKGRITVRHSTGDTEVVQAGDAFYLEPGHTYVRGGHRVRAVQPDRGALRAQRRDPGQPAGDDGGDPERVSAPSAFLLA